MVLEAVDTFVITLELVYRELIAREQLDGFNADVAEACDFVNQSLNFLRRYQDEQLPTHESHTPPLLHTGCVGRPKFEIPCPQIAVPPTARISPCFPGNGVRKRTTDTDWILTEIEHALNKIK